MTEKQIPEAQFEAQLREAIQRAFPWLPADQITHQDSFSFKFGHANVIVNSTPKNKTRARADVLLHFNGEPLAVFELKRPGIKLTKDDEEQGLSYARMIHPMPPLVVVSNSIDVRILETATGNPLQETDKSAMMLKTLMERGMQCAQADLKRAISTLMGTSPNIWMQAVQHLTDDKITELSGDWDNPLVPFAKDFLIPRQITNDVIAHIEQGHKLITIKGSPLSGKSNVLRELVKLTSDDPTIAILYLDADIEVKLLDQVSMILSDSLDWHVTPDEARHWLVNVSRTNGPKLVLAIDHMSADCGDLRRDIETLTSNQFGNSLRIIVALDDNIADLMAKTRNGRALSTFGSRSKTLTVGPLSDDEFKSTLNILANHRLTFTNGANMSDELRKPWLIRAITADAITNINHRNKNFEAFLSPVPGLEVIAYAQRHFDASQFPFARYLELAQALVEDLQDKSRPYQLNLELLNTFIVRRDLALRYLTAQELQEMSNIGLIRETRSESGDNIYVIRLPELIASEVSNLIKRELESSISSQQDTIELLLLIASSLPLGDVIVANAILNVENQNNGLSHQLIDEFCKLTPQRMPLAIGTKFALHTGEKGIVNFTIQDNGNILMEYKGKQEIIDAESIDFELPQTYSNTHSFQILSYLAGQKIIIFNNRSEANQRLDPLLLSIVGSSVVTLRNPNADFHKAGIYTHELNNEISIPCHNLGIIEPITWSLVRFFERNDQPIQDNFIQSAINDNNPALLSRIYSALNETKKSTDKLRSAWATEVLIYRLKPALDSIFPGFIHD